MKVEKENLINTITSLLKDKLNDLSQHIKETKEARDSDTKSSAGDKFETSREMAQIELNNLENQAAKTAKLLNEINTISLKPNESISIGSIVKTNKGNYFIAVPFGKLILEENTYFIISLASPIGQLLNKKTTGDKIAFNGNEIEILQHA